MEKWLVVERGKKVNSTKQWSYIYSFANTGGSLTPAKTENSIFDCEAGTL